MLIIHLVLLLCIFEIGENKVQKFCLKDPKMNRAKIEIPNQLLKANQSSY